MISTEVDRVCLHIGHTADRNFLYQLWSLKGGFFAIFVWDKARNSWDDTWFENYGDALTVFSAAVDFESGSSTCQRKYFKEK